MTKKHLHILTAGTSNGSWASFQRLIELSGADTVIDVRSRPYSRWPHFNQPALKTRLNYIGLPCVYLGHQLGGLMKGDERTYHEVSRSPEFRDGIVRVQEIASRCQPIIICAEHDPLQCHRFLLISRVMTAEGAEIGHVLRTGEIESQRETEVRMLKANGLYCEDYWTPFEEILSRGYVRQERRIRRLK